MAARKSSGTAAGGILVFLGSLVYLYVVWTWLSAGGAVAPGSWLSYAAFLAPFVVAVAVVGAISLFFMGLGTAAGLGSSMDAKTSHALLWKFIMLGGIVFLILGGAGWVWYVVIGFLLTYIGGMLASM